MTMKMNFAALGTLLFVLPGPPAHADLKSLQAKVTKHLAKPEVVKRVDAQNAFLDKSCAKKPLEERNPPEFSRPLEDESSILGNYEEILPGISRFEFPTFDALVQSHKEGVCDVAISLNMECILTQFDRDSDGSLSWDEDTAARKKLQEWKASEELIEMLIAFYGANGEVCLSPKKNKWHTVLMAKEPEESIETIFQGLELVLQARGAGKTACFHCAVGKHRTGLTAMLIEFAQADAIDDALSKQVYDNYLKHAWYSECASRVQTTEIVPLILESPEFADFKARWKKMVRATLQING